MKIASTFLAALGFSSCGTEPTPAPPRPTVDFSRVEQIAGTIANVQTRRLNAYRNIEYAVVPTTFDYHLVTINPDQGGDPKTLVMPSYTTESGPLIPLAPGTHLAGVYHPSNGQVPEYLLGDRGINGVKDPHTIKADGILQ